MTEYYYRASRGDGTSLYIAPLADGMIDAAGQELPTSGGHFLFERRDDDPTEVRVIAHIVSDEAVFEMRQLLKLEWA